MSLPFCFSDENAHRRIARRAFLGQHASGLGAIALSALLAGDRSRAAEGLAATSGGLGDLPHFAPRAKRVIYLFQSGGPSHIDLFEGSPVLRGLHGSELPPSVRGNQRVTGMTAGQSSFPVVAPMWGVRQCGPQGSWVSDLLPHTQQVADQLTFVKSVHTEAINHDPAITLINTGSQQIGHASLGSWLRPGERNGRFARVHRHAQSRYWQEPRPAAVRSAVG